MVYCCVLMLDFPPAIVFFSSNRIFIVRIPLYSYPFRRNEHCLHFYFLFFFLITISTVSHRVYIYIYICVCIICLTAVYMRCGTIWLFCGIFVVCGRLCNRETQNSFVTGVPYILYNTNVFCKTDSGFILHAFELSTDVIVYCIRL